MHGMVKRQKKGHLFALAGFLRALLRAFSDFIYLFIYLILVNSRTEEDQKRNYLNYASTTELGFSSLGMAEPGEVLPSICFLNVANS